MAKRKWPKPIEKNGRFFCPIEDCDHNYALEKGYASQRGYRKHMESEHPDKKPGEEGGIPPEVKGKIMEIEEQENLKGSKETEMDLEELYQTVVQFGREMEEMDIVQDQINLSSSADFILIVGLSDLHMGDRGVDYEYIDRLLDFVEKHDRVFAYVNGDLIANWVNFSPDSGGHDEVLPPKYQKRMAEWKLKQIEDSLLWIIQGNHEYRSEKQGEESPLERISRNLEVPYLGHGGRINLKINDIPYKMHARHKFRYNSSINPSHSCVRLNDMLDAAAEIVMIGHKHQPCIDKQFKAGKWRSYIRYGAAYPTSNFEEYLGYAATPLVAPSVLMSGDKKYHEPFMELEVAEKFIQEV